MRRAELDNLDRQLQAKMAEESRLRGVLAMYQARIEAAPAREAELAGADARLRDAAADLSRAADEERRVADLRQPRTPPDRRAVQGARCGAHAREAGEPRSAAALSARAHRRARRRLRPGGGGGVSSIAACDPKPTCARRSTWRCWRPFRTCAKSRRRAGGCAGNLAMGVGATTMLVVCAAVAWRLLR